jgi:hypothetical protein
MNTASEVTEAARMTVTHNRAASINPRPDIKVFLLLFLQNKKIRLFLKKNQQKDFYCLAPAQPTARASET